MSCGARNPQPLPESLKTYSDFELLIGEDESGVCGSEITGTGRETCSLSVVSSLSHPPPYSRGSHFEVERSSEAE